MELRHLRYFVAIAEERSFTRGGGASRIAAKQLAFLRALAQRTG